MVDWARYMRVPYARGGRSADGADCYGWARLVLLGERGILLPSFDGYAEADDPKVAATAALHANIDTPVDVLSGAPLRWTVVPEGEEEELDAVVFWDGQPGEALHVGLVKRRGEVAMMLNERGPIFQPYEGNRPSARFWRDRTVEFRRLT